MQTLYKSQYYEILFEENKSLIVHKALIATSEMSDEEFKQEMTLFAEMCEQYLPERDLVVLTDMNYQIIPEVQAWVNNHIFPRFVNIIKRMALVMPPSIFESIAVQQTLEEKAGQIFLNAYFDEESKAMEWLMQ